MKMSPLKLLTILILVSLLTLVPVPLPIAKNLNPVTSPDGMLTLIPYWKPAGVVGYFTESEPWVYGSLVEKKTGKEIKKIKIWADTPQDGVERLIKQLEWN